MTTPLKPFIPLTPLTPAFLIAAASGFAGLREEGGNNRGLMIELFLREVQQPAGQPWCAAFVYHVGYWSHYDHDARRSTWPLPATASCWMLGDFARKRGVLAELPAPGDVFLKFDPALRRFAHTGIVVQVPRARTSHDGQLCYLCVTIEGNTNDGGSREGNAVVRRIRRLNPDAGDGFIRWVDLDGRDTAATPTGQTALAA